MTSLSTEKEEQLWGEEQAEIWLFLRSTILISFLVYVAVLILALIPYVNRVLSKKKSRIARFIHLKEPQWIKSSENFKILSTAYDSFRLVSSMIVCTLYIYATYRKTVDPFVTVLNRIFASFSILHIISTITFAPIAFAKVFSIQTFIAIFALPSLIRASGPRQFLHFGFLQAFQFFDSYVNLDRRFINFNHQRTQIIAKIVLQLLVMFYILAAAIQLIEIPGDIVLQSFKDHWFPVNENWTFFNSYYWVVVSLSTVGYGDISPDTVLGRLFSVLMIISVIVVYLNIVEQLKSTLGERKVIGRYPGRTKSHVILTGAPTMKEIRDFADEFYSGKNSHNNANSSIIVLIDESSFSEEDWFSEVANTPLMENRMVYVEGSVHNREDLEKAGLRKATAVFILTSLSTGSKSFEMVSTESQSKRISHADTQTVMGALSVRNFRTDIPIFAQTILDKSNVQLKEAIKTAATSIDDESRCFRHKLDEILKYHSLYDVLLTSENKSLPKTFRHEKQKKSWNKKEVAKIDLSRSKYLSVQQFSSALMNANVKAPGISTLITNLYVQYEDEHGTKYDQFKALPWFIEYALGSECSLLSVIAPNEIEGVSVAEIAPMLFEEGIIIVGLRKGHALEIEVLDDLSVQLEKGHICCVLTYLQAEHLPAVFRDTIRKHSRDTKSEEKHLGIPDKNDINPYRQEGHIIIIVEGKTASDHLLYFLKTLNPDADDLIEVRIISEHDLRISSDEKQRYGVKDVIPESTLSKTNCERAGLENASGVTILTDPGLDVHSADSQTLHTLLAVESMVAENQNIFICSEIIDDETVNLLRAPKSARRLKSSPKTEESRRSFSMSTNMNRAQVYKGHRYASGEIIIQSTESSLLVREFVEPGFMAFIKELIGTPGRKQKLQLIPIPAFCFVNGQETTFDSVFATLVSCGILPIALYRASEVEVRYPPIKRWRRGKRQHSTNIRDANFVQYIANSQCIQMESPLTTDQFITANEPGRARNTLPYVFTLPEPYTKVSVEDYVYVLGPLK